MSSSDRSAAKARSRWSRSSLIFRRLSDCPAFLLAAAAFALLPAPPLSF